MNVGFTGTRGGMTDEQKKTFAHLLHQFQLEHVRCELHFGLCLGSDEEAAKIAWNYGWFTVAYPSDLPEWTSDFIPDYYAQEPKPPLKRNPDIVAASEIMIATPGEMQEVKRSGTWATIREAWRTNTPIYIIYPDRRIEYHGPE